MKRTFLKLDRKIIKSAIWNDGTPFDKAHAWMDLLLYVNYLPGERMFGDMIQKVKRGQTITSDNFLANRWNWSRGRVRRFLDMLESANMVRIKRTSYGTWITVVNYTKYQGEWTPNGTSNGTTVGTSVGTSNGTQLIESIEGVEGKREGQAPHSFLPPSRQDIEAYCHEKNYCIDTQLFIDYYDARDWTLGKGQKMSNWKSAVNAWVRRERKNVGDGISDEQAKRMERKTEEILKERKRKEQEAHTYDMEKFKELRRKANV